MHGIEGASRLKPQEKGPSEIQACRQRSSNINKGIVGSLEVSGTTARQSDYQLSREIPSYHSGLEDESLFHGHTELSGQPLQYGQKYNMQQTVDELTETMPEEDDHGSPAFTLNPNHVFSETSASSSHLDKREERGSSHDWCLSKKRQVCRESENRQWLPHPSDHPCPQGTFAQQPDNIMQLTHTGIVSSGVASRCRVPSNFDHFHEHQATSTFGTHSPLPAQISSHTSFLGEPPTRQVAPSATGMYFRQVSSAGSGWLRLF